LRRIQEVLSSGVEFGIIRSDINLDAAAKMYFSMIQGLVNLWTLRPNIILETEYKYQWDIFLAAIASKQPVTPAQ
jgi:hypothetical protein